MTRYVHSVWHQEPMLTTEPQLEGDLTADVVVVGAGIAGLSSAYYLAKGGAKVIVVERSNVAEQSSSRNKGVVTAVWNLGNGPIEHRKSLARFCHSIVPELTRVVEEEGFEVDLEPRRFWMMPQKKADVADAKAMAQDLITLGYDCTWVDGDKVDAVRIETLGGYFTRQRAVNPYKLTQALKGAIKRMGVQIFEQSEVIAVEDGTPAVVRTARGSVTAAKVVLAINAFGARFGLGDDLILPGHYFALATKPLPEAVTDTIGPKLDETLIDFGTRIDANNRYSYRLRKDGTMMIGGGSIYMPKPDEMFTPTLTQPKAEDLVQELRRRFPAIKDVDVDFYWGGTVATTVGEKPYIAPVPGSESLIMVLICNARGMALGSSAGRLVQELVQPGTVTDQDTLNFLQYCDVRDDLKSRLEGSMFKLMRSSAARKVVNTIFGGGRGRA